MEEIYIDGVGDDLARALVPFLSQDLQGFGAAGDREVGIFQRVVAEGLKGKGKIFGDVLFGFGNDFGGGEEAVSNATSVGGDPGPGFLPEIDHIRLKVAQDFGE